MTTTSVESQNFLCTQDTRWFLQAWSWRIIRATDVSGQPWDSLEEAILVDFHPPHFGTPSKSGGRFRPDLGGCRTVLSRFGRLISIWEG